MTFGGATGMWAHVGKLQQEEVDAIVRAALDAGVNFIDTADVYSGGRSEELLGQSLRNLGVRRDSVVVASKVASGVGTGPNDRGASRGHIMDSVHASLQRLQTDHIDLYQIHNSDTITRSRRPCARSTTWYTRGWCAMSACPTGRPGGS